MKAARAFLSAVSLAYIVATLVGLASCNLAPGGGTDVGNPELSARVTGSILHPDGSPATFVQLRLRPKAFLSTPDTLASQNGRAIQDGHSDTQGFFTFDSVPKGEYRIEAIDSFSRGALDTVLVDGSGQLLNVMPIIVDTTGWITGNVHYIGPPLTGNSQIIIAVYGMDRWTSSISGGDFTLSALPPGTYTLRIFAYATPSITTTISDVKLTVGGRISVGTVDLGP